MYIQHIYICVYIYIYIYTHTHTQINKQTRMHMHLMAVSLPIPVLPPVMIAILPVKSGFASYTPPATQILNMYVCMYVYVCVCVCMCVCVWVGGRVLVFKLFICMLHTLWLFPCLPCIHTCIHACKHITRAFSWANRGPKKRAHVSWVHHLVHREEAVYFARSMHVTISKVGSSKRTYTRNHMGPVSMEYSLPTFKNQSRMTWLPRGGEQSHSDYLLPTTAKPPRPIWPSCLREIPPLAASCILTPEMVEREHEVGFRDAPPSRDFPENWAVGRELGENWRENWKLASTVATTRARA